MGARVTRLFDFKDPLPVLKDKPFGFWWQHFTSILVEGQLTATQLSAHVDVRRIPHGSPTLDAHLRTPSLMRRTHSLTRQPAAHMPTHAATH